MESSLHNIFFRYASWTSSNLRVSNNSKTSNSVGKQSPEELFWALCLYCIHNDNLRVLKNNSDKTNIDHDKMINP
jgi:hypothetical protein